MTTLDDETARAKVAHDRRVARAVEAETAERYAAEQSGAKAGWSLDEDPWAGMVDDAGYPLDIAPAAEVAAEAIAAGESVDQMRPAHLPAEFWGARELFKQIWAAAKAEGTAPDAVLGAVLARTSAMVSHHLTFNSGKPGVMNMFVNLVAPSGIGKTEAMRTAKRLIAVPSYLCDRHGELDRDRYREASLGSGEGMAEIYMGTKDVDTGEFFRGGPNKGDPKTKTIRTQVRHNAFLSLDEGEALSRMMERRGATVGQMIRSAWTGTQLGQSNAQELTTRDIPEGSYAMGLLIGYQPHTAQEVLSDGGGGTPQRFLWLSALDDDMAAGPGEPPPPFRLPLCDGYGNGVEGVVQFPQEIKQALWDALRAKNNLEILVAELDSHEPLMRCKLAALLCVLDGRMLVDRDDWRLAGQLWSVSCAVRDRLVEYGKQQKTRQQDAERDRHAELAAAGETARIEVSERVVAYARQVATRACAAEIEHEFGTLGRSEERRRIKSNLRRAWDAGLEYALARGWVELTQDGARIAPGDSRPG
jgi:hypothetical protein